MRCLRQDKNSKTWKSQEKRKADESQENEAQPAKKKKKTSDIIQLMQAQLDKNTTNSQETTQEEPQEQQPEVQPTQEKPPQDLQGVHYGDVRDAEMVDWESIFTKHLEETGRMETERQEQIDMANKKEKS